MQPGLSMETLTRQVKDMEQAKRDFLAPASKLRMVAWHKDTPIFSLPFGGGEKHMLSTRRAVQTIASHYQIPMAYLDRLAQERPDLVPANLNGWLNGDKSVRLLRTLEYPDKMVFRAFLSDRYRPLDNWDLLQAALPLVEQLGLNVRSTALTDNHLYIKATLPALKEEIKKGDVVEAGVEIRNSEVGTSSVSVSWLVFRLICENGLVLPGEGSTAYHVGRKQSFGLKQGNVESLLRSETRMVEDAAFWMRFQDVVRGIFTPERFREICTRIRTTTKQEIGNPESVVEVTRKHFGLSEHAGSVILANLVRDGDLTRWGLVNAITRVAGTTEEYEEASRLEEVGGAIIELSPSQWRAIAQAA